MEGSKIITVNITGGPHEVAGHVSNVVRVSEGEIINLIHPPGLVNFLVKGAKSPSLNKGDIKNSVGTVYVAIHRGYKGNKISVRTSEKQWLRQMYSDNYFLDGTLYIAKFIDGSITDIEDDFAVR
jgi:hypothetical protein